MPRGKRTPAAVRGAVQARILTGTPVNETARALAVPQQTVSDIAAEVRLEKEIDYGALVAYYTAANLRSLTKQVELFGDPDWLRGQSAADLAILHGVQADKAIAILAGWQQQRADPGLERAIDADARDLDTR